MTFKISLNTHIRLFILSSLGVLIFIRFFELIILEFFLSMNPLTGFSMILDFYLYIIMLMTIISIAHESIHGLAYSLLGGKVKFGFRVIYAYCREISSLKLSRTKFLLVLLAPLVSLSIASIVMAEYSGIIFILNLLGSSGDIYMAFSLLKVKPENRIVDREYGYDVI